MIRSACFTALIGFAFFSSNVFAEGACHEFRQACKGTGKKGAVAKCVEAKAQAAGDQTCIAKIAKLKARRAEKRAAKKAAAGGSVAPASVGAPAAH